MNIREISKPLTAKALNESLAKRFGKKINLEAFTIEQLEDARNKLRTTLSQFETNESFDAVHSNETYQKNKLFLDVLNAAVAEAEAKPDFLDLDGDGDKKEPMKKAADDKKNKGIEAMKKAGNAKADAEAGERKKTNEGKEDEAELVMASKDMVTRVTSWMEDTAEMQTESMLELADAIRDEMGQAQSDAFVGVVKPALESMYTAMESTREALTQGVGMLTGEGEPPAEDMGAEPEMDVPADDAEMEPTVDQEDFAAADAADGGEEEAGRERRESRINKKKMIETSRKLGTILSKKK